MFKGIYIKIIAITLNMLVFRGRQIRRLFLRFKLNRLVNMLLCRSVERSF